MTVWSFSSFVDHTARHETRPNLTGNMWPNQGKTFADHYRHYMRRMRVLWCTVFAIQVLSAVPQNRRPPSRIDRIYAEDQLVRGQAIPPSAPKPIFKNDDDRENATRRLIADGDLHSGKDFEKAAVIFQHSHKPDDYLLSHSLALVALSKGDSDAVWIAAASLDRYLIAVGSPQIYGTQFLTPPGTQATQEPYARSIISDAIRGDLRVPSIADQERVLHDLRHKAQ